MKWGFVTYQWGEDWDLPTVIANCEKAGALGVELRTGHKHGVEPSLTAPQRREVRARFANSPVAFVGPGTAECFDHADAAKLAAAIEATKAFITLSHDLGGSGVKVRPNNLHPGVPREKTIEQIGKSLNVVAAFGAGYGQQIRLEIHGKCRELPTIKQIMDVADHPNVALCWNCNPSDVEGAGLESNFDLVKNRLGATAHVRQLNGGAYPYRELMGLFVKADYAGWLLLEDAKKPADPVKALIEQREIFEGMAAAARANR